MAETAFGQEPKQPPKELTVDLGNGVKLEMVLIPAGEFMMGSPDSDKDAEFWEKPQHRVRITKPFYLGKYPVTQEQWEALMGSNPSTFHGAKNPVDLVSWDDCQAFLSKLNVKTDGQVGEFQLPSEAQWEYACRAGSKTKYYFGDDEFRLGEYAWYVANSGFKTHPVGLKKPNAWGLYDMHGNVHEWCADWAELWNDMHPYYARSPKDDPTGLTTGSHHVFRGCSFASLSSYCGSAYRFTAGPGIRDMGLGFRVSRALADTWRRRSSVAPRWRSGVR
jgi:formylglycine-generating enzyme required for sulfatase activity